MPSQTGAAWARLGEMLVRRRLELDPRYRNRRTFTRERAPDLYRIINDIELGRRDNYEPATIAALEVAYDLPRGAIGSFLLADAEDEWESEDGAPARPARTRVNKSMARTEDLVPFIRDIADELDDGIEPSPFEQVIWDSDISAEEKWNLLARIRQANARLAREAETGLVTAGHGPFTAS